MLNNEKKIAVGYVRVSTLEQEISPEDQKEKILAYCTTKDFLLRESLVEIDVSGGVPLSERPEGSKLFKYDFDVVVSTKLDRLFRNVKDCLSVTEEWSKKGIPLHIIDMGGVAVDTSTAMGRMFLTLIAAFAEMERTLIKERTRAALQYRIKNGKRAGTVPYGFTLCKDGEKLVKNISEIETIKEILSQRSSGLSFIEIAALLDCKGLKTKAGRSWNQSTVRGIVKRYENKPI